MDATRYAAIKTRVETLYALSAEGKWPEAQAMMTDDFCIVEADSLPFAGRYAGKDALQRLYAKVFGFWDDPSIELHDMTISENHVIALLTIHATARHTGERMTMPLCEVFHLRGDLIAGITPYYYDTAAIARSAGTVTPA